MTLAVISSGGGALPGPDAPFAEEAAAGPAASPRCPHCGFKSRHAIPARIWIEAIRARLRSGDNLTPLAGEYGIDRSTFCRWRAAPGISSLRARYAEPKKAKPRRKRRESYQRVYREPRIAVGVEIARSQIAPLAAKEAA